MRWFWIDRIIEIEKATRIVAIKNVSLAEEHVHDHLREHGYVPGSPSLPSSVIIEGMAQTAGILVGHANDYREQVILAKITRADLRRDVPPGSTIRFTAEIEQITPQGASTKGVVDLLFPGDTLEPIRLGEISLVFSHLKQSGVGGDVPDENFVFTGEIWSLLGLSLPEDSPAG